MIDLESIKSKEDFEEKNKDLNFAGLLVFTTQKGKEFEEIIKEDQRILLEKGRKEGWIE